MVLARAYIVVSADPIIGDQQQSDTFWMKIAKRVLETSNPGNRARSQVALKSRWHQINHDVQKFIGHLNHIISLNISGENEAGKIARAKQLYLESQQKPFCFEGCWMILKKFFFLFFYCFDFSHLFFQSP
jgi:hypothetical protein